MNRLKYPLEQLLAIKKNRYDQAVKLLEEKKAQLIQEQKKLFDVEQIRNRALEHKNAKLLQLRTELDQGTTSDKIKQMKDYLKVVEIEVAEKQKKVDAQQKEVVRAENQVEAARKEVFAKEKDLEKLKIHQKEWEKEVKYWTEQKENVEQDELGSAQHVRKKKQDE